MNFTVMPDETLEDLKLNGLYILQKKAAFRFGVDAVILSHFVSARKDQKILDIGTGTGIIPILLSAKTEAKFITGLEIQYDIAAMARRSVEGNDLNDRIEIITGDIKEAHSLFGASVYDVVVTNPPYTKVGGGLTNSDNSKAIAKHELFCTLDDVLKNAAYALKPQGVFYMVHRPDRLTDILVGMRKYKLEPKLIRMVCPREGEAPSLLLVKGLKNGNPGLKVLQQLIIYDKNGQYTAETRMIYSENKI